jgi:hypothetical protein
MNDTAKLDRAIRFNAIGGIVLLVAVALRVALGIVGRAPLETSTLIWLVFAVPAASLALVTAWSLRRDRDDPAGIEQRFQAAANTLGAAVVIVGFGAIAGLILWGLQR